MTGRDAYCLQRLQEALPDIAELITGAADEAELAILALSVPDALLLWGTASRTVQHGFREAVRDRYTALVEEQQAVLEPR